MTAARGVREKEAKVFNKFEAELLDIVDTLPRAIAIIRTEVAKNAAFLQKKIDTRNLNNVVAALTAVVDAGAFSSVDKQKLVALLQSRQSSDDHVGGFVQKPQL